MYKWMWKIEFWALLLVSRFIEIQLTYNKLHVFNMYNFMSWHMYVLANPSLQWKVWVSGSLPMASSSSWSPSLSPLPVLASGQCWSVLWHHRVSCIFWRRACQWTWLVGQHNHCVNKVLLEQSYSFTHCGCFGTTDISSFKRILVVSKCLLSEKIVNLSHSTDFINGVLGYLLSLV